MRKAALAVLVLGLCVGAWGQAGLQYQDRELTISAAGGHSVPGGTKDTGIFDAGLRYGWIFGTHGAGFLRGNFEYAVDAVPVYLVIHDGTTYSAGFDPLVLKWNFAAKKAVPFIELQGGTLFSNHEVPPGTSSVNFRSGAAIGVHFVGKKWGPTIALRYEHISNAGLASPNPGINTVQIQVGISRFRPCKALPRCAQE